MSKRKYTCSLCGRVFDDRSQVVEIQDPVVVSKGRVKQGDFICYNCINKIYEPPSEQPRKVTVVCPRCGEVIEAWL